MIQKTQPVSVLAAGTTGSNPDLAFYGIGLDSRLHNRHVLEKVPRSQHRPSHFILPRLILPVLGRPVKR